jgi:hypothetical protein
MAFEVRNTEIEELLRMLGRWLKEQMPEGFGFSLLIFSYKPGSMFYTSSAERDTMIQAMREFIAKHEHN